jgi:hypothetical protein
VAHFDQAKVEVLRDHSAGDAHGILASRARNSEGSSSGAS